MSDVEKRNAAAVMAALENMNKILSEYGKKLNKIANEVVALNQELTLLRQKNIEDLVSKMGSGPTV